MSQQTESDASAKPAEVQLAVAGKKGVPAPVAPFCKPASAPVAVKKVAIIYNPYGGKKKAQKLLDRVIGPMFAEAGVEVVPHQTQHAGHGIELARTISLAGIDGLCALGGDGTLSEVMGGLVSREDGAAVPLGFIPGGTGNCFLWDAMGVRTKGEKVVRMAVTNILGGLTRRVDCGKIEYAPPWRRILPPRQPGTLTCGPTRRRPARAGALRSTRPARARTTRSTSSRAASASMPTSRYQGKGRP